MMNFFKRKKQVSSEVSVDKKIEESEHHPSDSEPNSEKQNYESWSPDTEISNSAEHLVMETPTVSDDELELIANAGGFKEQVTAALKKVYDPEIPVNIVDLGLIYSCEFKTEDNGNKLVDIKMTLTAPGCGMGPVIADEVKQKVKNVQGVDEINLELVWDPPWDQSMISEAARLEMGLL